MDEETVFFTPSLRLENGLYINEDECKEHRFIINNKNIRNTHKLKELCYRLIKDYLIVSLDTKMISKHYRVSNGIKSKLYNVIFTVSSK